MITFILWNLIFKLFKINIITVFNALPCVAKSLWLIGLIVEFVLLFCKTVRINESNIFWLHTCTFPSSFWYQQCTNLINDYKQLAECVFHRETTGSLQLLCLLISPIMTLSYPSDRPSAWVAHYRHFNTASRTSTEETGQTDRTVANSRQNRENRIFCILDKNVFHWLNYILLKCLDFTIFHRNAEIYKLPNKDLLWQNSVNYVSLIKCM